MVEAGGEVGVEGVVDPLEVWKGLVVGCCELVCTGLVEKSVVDVIGAEVCGDDMGVVIVVCSGCIGFVVDGLIVVELVVIVVVVVVDCWVEEGNVVGGVVNMLVDGVAEELLGGREVGVVGGEVVGNVLNKVVDGVVGDVASGVVDGVVDGLTNGVVEGVVDGFVDVNGVEG